MRRNRGARWIILSGSLLAIGLAFVGFVRPWYLRWGATDAETHRSLPGDAIIPNATRQETRAITIHAPVEQVWPWLAQLGQDRGGFYSYDLLENLVGCGMPTEDRLRPDRQSWQVGDKLWMYPPEKAGGIGFATLRTYLPGRALGFGTRSTGTPLTSPEDGSWSFVLDPMDDGTTRLLVRGRGAAGRSLLGVAFDRSVFEPMHFVMERRTMIGLQQLAEGRDRGRVSNHVAIGLWTITFAFFVTAMVSVIRHADRWHALAGLFTAAAAFQILTFVQPPLGVGFLLTVIVGLSLWWPRKPHGVVPSPVAIATRPEPSAVR
ncbi:MAG TPA: hypothetical protein VJ816_06440 [Gemmatimonadales bacterium]|nr:hypothetical protein [Gemmatimonadales bacterium]